MRGMKRTLMRLATSACLAAGTLVSAGGCEWIEHNPRTAGTVGGAAAGAAAGAVIDRDEPARGAVIGGVVGGAAGNVGGKIYKDNRD
ncbi:MAG TPA: YMGG-like glycine zipper-containing protein [Tepidisphaeraceae bacterium]|jgi:phage tail tape-measure protein